MLLVVRHADAGDKGSWLAADGLVTAAPLHWPKGSTWLLQRTDQGQVYGRLLAPLALERLHLAEP
jgi:hypothetical protein